MKKKLLPASVVALVLAAAAAGAVAGVSYSGKLSGPGIAASSALPAASAKPTSCSVRGKYSAIDPNVFPGVGMLRAFNLPARTNGYAPRCLVAESVVGLVQHWVSANEDMPKRLRVHGASWDAGVWRMSYRFHKTREGGWMQMIARHRVQRITANLYS